ncbi:MAG: CHAD domain-containing protein [Armatimonadetes bacterium]|nr:CHAD domain-containing protein [Armatimonadota bacterium]
MPRPIMPEGLTPSTRTAKAARLIIDAKIDELLAYAKSAISGDVDGVHDMRIASKRLREAMRLFRRLLPKKCYARVMALVEQLNDALGRVRELDVMMADCAALATQTPQAAPVLEVVAAIWAERRAQVQGDLVLLWDNLLGKGKLLRRLRGMARSAGKRGNRLSKLPLEQYAYLAIAAATERVKQRLEPALSSNEPGALHPLRIAVKRLKYSIEPFLTALPALQAPYEDVAKLQETLGTAQDYNVLALALTDYLAERELLDTEASQAAVSTVKNRQAETCAAAREQAAILSSTEWYRKLLDAMD